MKFSVNWLREFVELPASVEQLADLLTMAGIEIEGIESCGANFDQVIVAQIQQSRQHPNADRLSICVVDDGSGRTRQIVCGAKNYEVGDKVPLALPGAELSGGLRIRESKLRGVDSQGMLCSAKELGIAEDATGLLILSPEARIGAPIGEIFPTDIIFDVEITPNRGDLLSHFGLAREIAALTGKQIVTATVPKAEALPPQTKAGNRVTISALRECPFYSAHRMENVRVGRSPDWLRARIEAAGIRSINNVVDISNYVMLELGQPTHAFDADKIRGGIDVRLARDGEKFLALDGKTYTLTTRDLVIADQERVVGIGGVMGGEESGVTEATRNVLLESAYFLPASIRRTARTLNLPSDASYRFERGVDRQMILPASQRTAELMRQITGGTPGDSIDVAGELPPNPLKISLRYERCDELLGRRIESKTVDAILNSFGLQKNGDGGWRIPSYRRDLQGEVDLIEEVIRVYGIDKIPSADRSRFTPLSEADRIYDFETKLRRDLIALGLNEARTSSLIARDQTNEPHERIELRNPLSEDHVALRVSLIPGLLAALARNVRAGAERIALFELGNIFSPPKGDERRSLGIVLWGTTGANWRNYKKRRVDFFDLKGVIESLRVPELKFRRGERPSLVLTAEILFAKKRIGFCGQLSNTEAAMLDANGAVLVAEIDLLEIAQSRQRPKLFSGLERYPAVRRDIAMFVAPNVTHAEILRVIDSANEPLLERVELFDLFTEKVGGNAGEDRKSLAYSLTYRDKNRTLTNEEVSTVHARIRDRLQREVRAELRE
ncbi:MAG: phenylalanine--tRNA ligase subunit beta [Verrucomicrobia bacterium]|nr:MAG: phenylalanine--tRNA ligase subunit beta [Verrucomicrobiota bacterium]